MRLHLVRHFAPLVSPGICYGRTDLAVDPGLHERLTPALHARLPYGLPLFSSPLQRCATLAASLGGAAVRYDERLAELDFGSWEMQPWEAIARAEIDAWAIDPANYSPGGADSVAAMAVRVASFYDDLLSQALPGAVVVCHAGTIRLLTARARGLAPEAMARAAAERPHAVGYGEIVVLDCV